MSKTVIFLDGVSGVGKTTVADMSVDFLKYLQVYPGFAKKNDLMHVQYLYDHTVTNDVLNYLDTVSRSANQDVTIVDRSFYSTAAYDILFKYNGHYEEPSKYQAEVEEKVFSDETYTKMLTTVWQSWERRFNNLYLNLDIKLLWVIPRNIDKVVENLMARGTFEIEFNVKNYILNQIYTFKKLHEITNVGEIAFVDQYITTDIVNKYSQ